jgi:hypothetical protein
MCPGLIGCEGLLPPVLQLDRSTRVGAPIAIIGSLALRSRHCRELSKPAGLACRRNIAQIEILANARRLQSRRGTRMNARATVRASGCAQARSSHMQGLSHRGWMQ